MILSAQQTFSDDQAITATAISTNVIDTGARGTPFGAVAALNGDIGKGTLVPFLFQVTESFNNLTSLTVAIEQGATTSLGTVVESTTVPLASLTVGYQLPIQVLPKGLTGRYIGMRYTVTGTAPTTGKVVAGITMGVQTNVTGA